jgi:hypothetical protein
MRGALDPCLALARTLTRGGLRVDGRSRARDAPPRTRGRLAGAGGTNSPAVGGRQLQRPREGGDNQSVPLKRDTKDVRHWRISNDLLPSRAGNGLESECRELLG